MIPVIEHLVGEDALRGELDAPPDPALQFLFLRNVTTKVGKPPAYLNERAEVFLHTWNQITFVDVMGDISLPSGNASATPTANVMATNGKAVPAGIGILGFFRDDEW